MTHPTDSQIANVYQSIYGIAPTPGDMQFARAVLALSHTKEAAPSEELPEGWRLVAVNEGWEPLMSALERAHRKGYMPDAITDDYEGFDYRIAATQAPEETT